MSRELPQWIGKSADSAIPARVQDRVSQRSNDCCVKCCRPVTGKLRAEIDHVIPLIIGGKHQEDNLQLLCHECHGAKTKLDVKLKAKVARVRKKHLGIKKIGRPMPGSKASGLRKRMDGTVERRGCSQWQGE